MAPYSYEEMTLPARRRWLWFALIAAVLLGVYSCMGVVMAGTFTGNRTAAYIYLGLIAVSVGVAAVIGAALWRGRVKE